MGDGMSHGYRAQQEQLERALEQFGSLSTEELEARQEVLCEMLSEARQELNAVQENLNVLEDRESLIRMVLIDRLKTR